MLFDEKSQIDIDEKNIIWPGDKGKKFKNVGEGDGWKNKQWIDMEDGK